MTFQDDGASAPNGAGAPPDSNARGAAAVSGAATAGGTATAPADWRAGIADPKVRAFADRLDSPAAAAKSAYELRTKLSSAIFKPSERASEAERSALRRALGVPERAEAYPFRPRDGVPSEFYTSDQARTRLGEVATILHKHDVRGAAMQELVDWYTDQVAGAQRAQHARDRAYADQTRAALEAEWGEGMAKNLDAANLAQRELLGGEAGDEFAALTLSDGSLVGDHPLVLKLLAGVGARLAEDGAAGAPTGRHADTLNEQANAARARRDAAMAAGDAVEARLWDAQEREILGRLHRG